MGIKKVSDVFLIIYACSLALMCMGNAITYFGGIDCTIVCQMLAIVSLMGAGGYFGSLWTIEKSVENN